METNTDTHRAVRLTEFACQLERELATAQEARLDDGDRALAVLIRESAARHECQHCGIKLAANLYAAFDADPNQPVESVLAILRANFERLAARFLYMDMMAFQCAADDLRRVLAGETPPEPGANWPLIEVPAGTFVIAHKDGVFIGSEQAMKHGYGYLKP